jgi:HNH endonuclease
MVRAIWTSPTAGRSARSKHTITRPRPRRRVSGLQGGGQLLIECPDPVVDSSLERLLDRTVLGPTHPELGTCWKFTGTTTPYGRIAKAQDSYTHRLGWKLLRGPIPEGKELHHRCGVYACWNPDHLEPVTHAENQSHLRKTHCKHGHLPADQPERRAGLQGV